jgi:hypothetical protein
MSSTSSAQSGIDPRGPRFGAVITTVMLALAFVLLWTPQGSAGYNVACVLLAVQTLVFALGAIVGLSAQPYGWIYRRFVRPRLSPPSELEDPAPPRFAQVVGLAFAVVALISAIFGAPVVAIIATGCALIAAFLNAAFALCLGCEMYLIGRRLVRR